MSGATAPPPVEPVPEGEGPVVATAPAENAGPDRGLELGSEVAAWLALAAALLLVVPLVLHMAVWGDATIYDLAARSILRRGNYYRYVFEHKPPGIVWFQLGVRSLVGWSSFGLRCADLVILAASVWFMLRATEAGRQSRAAAVWIATAVFLCYSTATEWSHCQPDLWMLLPAVAALNLLQGQVIGLAAGASGRVLALTGLAQGVLWGAAFLIKPFVAVPVVFCLLSALALAYRGTASATSPTRQIILCVASVMAGGLLILGGAVAVLKLTGDWNEFLSLTFGGWNKDYALSSGNLTGRSWMALTQWPRPWHWLNALAVPGGVYLMIRAAQAGSARTAGATRDALMSAFYLGWFIQANFVQLQFEYHTLPALLLAWFVALDTVWTFMRRLTIGLLLPGVVVLLALGHPFVATSRMRLWAACWTVQDSDHLKDALTRHTREGHTTWEDLRGVIDFLKERGAGDREVTCWQWSAIPVYTELNLEPSNRFLFPGTRIGFFPSFKQQILDETMHSPQRYVVVDLMSARGQNVDYRQPMELRPEYFRPFNPAQIFHFGRYVVLVLDGPVETDDKAK